MKPEPESNKKQRPTGVAVQRVVRPMSAKLRAQKVVAELADNWVHFPTPDIMQHAKYIIEKSLRAHSRKRPND